MGIIRPITLDCGEGEVIHNIYNINTHPERHRCSTNINFFLIQESAPRSGRESYTTFRASWQLFWLCCCTIYPSLNDSLHVLPRLQWFSYFWIFCILHLKMSHLISLWEYLTNLKVFIITIIDSLTFFFSFKGQKVIILGFQSHTVPVGTTQLCHCRQK